MARSAGVFLCEGLSLRAYRSFASPGESRCNDIPRSTTDLWQLDFHLGIIDSLDIANLDTDLSPPAVTAAYEGRRLAWEAARIAEARAEFDAGLFVEEADVDAWIDSLGTAHELPVPSPRR